MTIQTKLLMTIIGTPILFFNACATSNKNLKIDNNIQKIEQNKQLANKKNIIISNNNGYKVYINQDDKIKFICTSNNKNCNYYDQNKHDYKNGMPEEEIITINNNGYYPPFSPKTRGIQCGIGSLYGWLAIFPVEPFSITNYSKKKPIQCYSKYTQVDNSQIGPRIGFGLFTFMTPLISGGTMHTNKFDKEKFINAIYISNIESFKDKLISLIENYNLKGGIDIIYLEKGYIDDNLEDKYKSLIANKVLKVGLIFLEKDTNKLLGIDIFAKYKDKNILKSISIQIEDLLNVISANNQYILKYKDILPYIPKEIPLPKIPPLKELLKDEFETKEQFQKRVKHEIQKREKQIRDLQKEYTLNVFEKNTYIDGLQKAYENYLEYKAQETNELLFELKENIPLLSKVLFLENTSGYNAKEFTYDAETQKLYFEIYSRNNSFNQKVVASIPADIAKNIKLNKTFKILPDIEVNDNTLILKGFEILEIISSHTFKISYTNLHFKPEVVRLRVSGMKENIKKQISNQFKKYKQKNMPIVDTSKKEIWYIDIVNNINANIPKWFSHPNTNKTIGYGEGSKLEKAKLHAREELAYMIKVRVNSSFTSSEDINNFKSFTEFKTETKQNSDISLSLNDYKLYKQEKKDGIWYVGFEYINPPLSTTP